MNSGTVDLIATDPPFNKNRDFHSTPDSLAAGASFEDRWTWKQVHEDWIDTIKDDKPAVWELIDAAKVTYGEGMAAFLCFMGVRIMEMHRVLKDTGTIYLHCDPTASHYLKLMLDAVFGWKQFRNEVVWFYPDAPGRGKSTFPKKHDLLLLYSKSSKAVFNPDAVRIPILEASKKRYRTQRTLGGRQYVGGVAAEIGKIPEDVWRIPIVKTKERVGYPTQKPLALYERIIKASSNEGDMVLDPFCGCATTLIAAERLSREWVGIDIWKKAHETVWNRLLKYGLAVEGVKKKGQGHIEEKDMVYRTDVPTRTDDGEEVVPRLPTVRKFDEPGIKMTRKEMYKILVEQNGCRCEGCYRAFDDPDYLELDHNTPKADGGMNHINNRILLCSPCNKRKGHRLTLSGLREKNRREGKMSQTPPPNEY